MDSNKVESNVEIYIIWHKVWLKPYDSDIITGIILHAPTLYDDRQPIDVKLSEVAQAVLTQRKAGWFRLCYRHSVIISLIDLNKLYSFSISLY